MSNPAHFYGDEEMIPKPPDDPEFGWSGVHRLIANDTGTVFRCLCGRSEWDHPESVRTHIIWALTEQNRALWNAGQRICNQTEGALEELHRVLDLCTPRTEEQSRELQRLRSDESPLQEKP